MRLALYQPDIPQNTGTILRMAACLAIPVDIIGPTGFDMTDRALRRAGLDYLDHVTITRHLSFEHFLEWRTENQQGRLILLTTHARYSYVDFAFDKNDTLLLGRESAGVPEAVHTIADERVNITLQKDFRSLNIAIAGAMVLGEALRQTGRFPVSSL